MTKEHEKLQRLLSDCGMNKPGFAQAFGIDEGKVHRMYYGRDKILPGVIESLEIVKASIDYSKENIIL